MDTGTGGNLTSVGEIVSFKEIRKRDFLPVFFLNLILPWLSVLQHDGNRCTSGIHQQLG